MPEKTESLMTRIYMNVLINSGTLAHSVSKNMMLAYD